MHICNLDELLLAAFYMGSLLFQQHPGADFGTVISYLIQICLS